MAIELSKLNEVQREAVKEIFGPCMIIAGAGSGKTRVLTYKVAHLVESGFYEQVTDLNNLNDLNDSQNCTN